VPERNGRKKKKIANETVVAANNEWAEAPLVAFRMVITVLW
jgi:hypothetical protein